MDEYAHWQLQTEVIVKKNEKFNFNIFHTIKYFNILHFHLYYRSTKKNKGKIIII